MKTQKQLPNEFTFICDEHSREQLEKLGVRLSIWFMDANGMVYSAKDNNVIALTDMGFPLINLADYIEQEQPELIGTIPASKSVITSVLSGFNGSMEIKTNGNRIPIGQKWQEKTRGGYEYHIYEEFNRKIYGRIKTGVSNWIPIYWYDKGNYSFVEKHSWDLLPIDHELTTLQKELEEVRLKEKQILEKIEELKK